MTHSLHAKRRQALLPALLAALSPSIFVGCGTTIATTAPAIVTLPGAHIQGNVHGGQSPIMGVNVQLYAAGSSGYGSAYPYTSGTSLLGTNVVTTDVNGDFSITNDYTCPTPTTQVYLVGTGGYPIPGQAANLNLALMAALGPCGALSSASYIAVNELTTIASVWALSPFMTGISNIGTTSANPTGLANAFAAVNKMVDTRYATLPGPALPSGATLPTSEINTLADMIEACVDSAGGTAGDGSNCGSLFTLAPSASGVAPTDTITAAMNIAQNPGRNVAPLNALPTAKSAFQPTLGNTPPAAWTIGIRYTAAASLSSPAGIAVDQSGNVWIANKGSHTVIQLDNNGAVLSGASGYAAGLSGSGAIAIDQLGNAWVAANTSGSILRISPSGATSIFSGGGLTTTTSIAIDPQGQVWAAGSGNSLSAFTSSGTPVSATGFTGGGINNPQSIAIAP